jgi:hypothetical protein
MPIPPILFLALVLLLTAGALLWTNVSRRPLRRELQRLARESHLAFSASDRFNLADRVAAAFPVPGAAAVHIGELIYGSRDENYHYLFVVEYTVGILRAKHRLRRVAAFSEPKSAPSGPIAHLEVAPDGGLSLAQQFEALLRRYK